MQQYKFWAIINVNGNKERREFVFNTTSWTEARRLMSEEIKKVRTQ